MPPPYRRPVLGEHEVLISPGYGAGWSTWCYGDRAATIMALTDPKVIREVKRARRAGESINPDVIADFEERFEARFPGQSFYTGGSRDLDVRIVSGPFIVNEYDGSESIQQGTNHFIDLDEV